MNPSPSMKAITKDWTQTFSVNGIELKADISPCSWMYPHYGLQVSIAGAGFTRLHNRASVTFEAAMEADAIALCAVHMVPCSKCQGWAADPKKHDTNRAGQCEKCFMTALRAEFAKEQSRADAKEAKKDKQMYAKGYRFKMVAWVHPSRGDDYMIVSYSAERPTDAECVALLKRKRSRVTNDYKVTEMKGGN